MKKCWIKTDHVPKDIDYIKSGKWYEVTLRDGLKGGIFRCDDGELSFTALEDSSHIDGDWQVYYGNVPPDFVEEPTINDKPVANTKVASNEVIQVLDRTSNDSISDGMETQDFVKLLDNLKSGKYSVIRNTNIN